MRVLALLDEVSPRALDIAQLAYLDYCMLHSGEFGGPGSLHPTLPAGPGELGVKRKLIESGLQLMLRASMVEVRAERIGIVYAASDSAEGFLNVLDSKYIEDLKVRAKWVAGEIASMNEQNLGEAMKRIYATWARGSSTSTQTLLGEEASGE
ncbi:ABC-three component system middle component 2 [Streptomyces sp. NPDC091289]|uniref:ABC-three component system middle component 2 n=1 Tax=Streptomyces sp. NPDC091289 TaxID=3365989 RepID=UPI0037F60D10